jgi:hypothetical protein
MCGSSDVKYAVIVSNHEIDVKSINFKHNS